jgi:hypothetical protein
VNQYLSQQCSRDHFRGAFVEGARKRLTFQACRCTPFPSA